MSTRKRSEYPEDPHENDVLRGLPGHNYFRQLVKKRGKIYLASRFQSEKKLIAANIVSDIRNLDPPGRFLSRDLESGFFYEIGDAKAIEKTKQALAKTKQAVEKETKAKNKKNTAPRKSEIYSQWYTSQYASQYTQQYAQQYAKQYAKQYNRQCTQQYVLQQPPFAHRPARSSVGPSKSEINSQQKPPSVYRPASNRPSYNDFGQPSTHHVQVSTQMQHFPRNPTPPYDFPGPCDMMKSLPVLSTLPSRSLGHNGTQNTTERIGRRKRQVARRSQSKFFKN